jgi:phosphoglycolate phosphatase-like HAD superfamily hydrolase
MPACPKPIRRALLNPTPVDVAVVFLDFDGVILESTQLKSSIYRELFADYPDRLDEVLALHKRRAGLPRAATLRLVYDEVLHAPLTDDQLAVVLQRFRTIAMRRLRDCEEVPGFRQLLSVGGRRRFYVVSGAPEDEVLATLVDRGLAGAFAGIFGAPHVKPDVLRRLIAEEGIEPISAIYVGDSANDRAAATSVGVPFVARITEDPCLSSSPGWPTLQQSLFDLVELLGPPARASQESR